jgi:hypothetical protein
MKTLKTFIAITYSLISAFLLYCIITTIIDYDGTNGWSKLGVVLLLVVTGAISFSYIIPIILSIVGIVKVNKKKKMEFNNALNGEEIGLENLSKKFFFIFIALSIITAVLNFLFYLLFAMLA